MEDIQKNDVPEVIETEEEQPDVEALTRQLDEVKSSLQQKTLEYEFYRRASDKGISNIDKLMPFIDLSQVGVDENVDTLGEIIDVLSQTSPQVKKSAPKTIGEPTNGGHPRVDKTPEIMLKQAGEKARKSGKLEDRAAFSSLKQKLLGGK